VRGLLLPCPVLVLAQLMLGALIEAALLITYAADLPGPRHSAGLAGSSVRIGLGQM
jgi:hypothetical protein